MDKGLRMEQLSLFPKIESDLRAPMSLDWNLWHGCTKVSAGCKNCYMYRRDHSIGKDPSVVTKTENFDLPIRVLKSGLNKGLYKVPRNSYIYTCFSSDFFHPAADEWRDEAWAMIRQRSDCKFFMITKRPERIAMNLPDDWGKGWQNVIIAVTCENQQMADIRLPIYLTLPLSKYGVMIEPMLSGVDLRPYIKKFRTPDNKPLISLVTVGGESGSGARICDYEWVTDVHYQCKENGISFYYHQTGARLLKDKKLYNIPRKYQHSQAKRAGLDMN